MSARDPLPESSAPVLEALRRAPRVELLTPEQRAELDADVAAIEAGRGVGSPVLPATGGLFDVWLAMDVEMRLLTVLRIYRSRSLA